MERIKILAPIVLLLIAAAALLPGEFLRGDPALLAAPLLAGPSFTDWSSPTNLGQIVNSTSDDNHPQISKDGLSLFFHSNRPGGFGGEDIWVSQRPSPDTAWGPPQNPGSAINSGSNDRVPYLFLGEQWMIFGSNRPGGSGGIDLWISRRSDKRDDFSWEPAVNVGSWINTASDDDGATLFEDDYGRLVLYFTSNRPGGAGDFDLYQAVQQPDGTFSAPASVPGINTSGRDTRTAITRDGLELFLTSNRTGSELLDIWTATREGTEENWSTLSKVPFISSSLNDGAPGISFDRQTLFFYSNRPGGLGGNDLYMTTRTRLHGTGR